MFLVVLPVGDSEQSFIDFLVSNVGRSFGGCVCRQADSVLEMPAHAYNLDRKQHDSSVVLAAVSDFADRNRLERVLGVTDFDLYASGLNFVFGVSQTPGRAAIISLCRLRPEFYGQPESKEVLEERALKEAVHEVGHTFGLRHCASSLCVMRFSNSISETAHKTALFCRKCSFMLSQKV